MSSDYAAMAAQHWARWLPTRYAQIPEPKTTFFAELGQRVTEQIEDLALELEGPDVAGETYLQRVGRMNEARMRAREVLLPREILLPPEPGTDPDPDPTTASPSSTDQSSATSATAAAREQQLRAWVAEGIPFDEPIGPDHPYWPVLQEEEQNRAAMHQPDPPSPPPS